MSEEQQAPKENKQETVNLAPKPQSSGFNYGIQQSLPNATAVLVLGILSIVTCWCYGIIGIILGIVALVLSKKDRALYAANMSFYTEGSFKNLNAGRVCAIIGLILNVLLLVVGLIVVAFFGWTTISHQGTLRDALPSL